LIIFFGKHHQQTFTNDMPIQVSLFLLTVLCLK